MFGFVRLFRSTARSPLPALSLIGDDTTIRGDVITGTGDLRVEGTVHADVEREGRVVIASGGAVYGTVRAESIQVAGTARGALCATDTLELTGSADVRARLRADALTVAPGADFRGEVCNTNEDARPRGDGLRTPVPALGHQSVTLARTEG
jgi:cytoskeletal protein CcmA (bactofilin family)